MTGKITRLNLSNLGRQGAKLLEWADDVRGFWSDAFSPPPDITPPIFPPEPSAPPAPLPRDFAPNPGGLTLHSFIPHHLPRNAPLVVVLHGCGQDPEDFATESGWRALAMRHHFALLMPGQTEDNNRQRCFNWFRAEDCTRDKGEAGSVVSMIEAMVKATHTDRRRIFVTGLSAGGAMTANLLAIYPDLFAGGAVVAGLPAGAARNMVSAMTRMSGHGSTYSADELVARAQGMAPRGFNGPWPRLSIWHGQDDTVVSPGNGAEVALQFASLSGIDNAITTPVGHAGSQHTVWGSGPKPNVELWSLAAGGHDYPPHAAHEIARFWGIVPA